MAVRAEVGELARSAPRWIDFEPRRRHAAESTDLGPRASECPSADDILGFCAGELTPARGNYMQRHLDVCPTCMDLVTLALNGWEPREAPGWLDVASNFRPGDRIEGRFLILRYLGCGGMGEVYEALDLKTSARVALKAVLAAASDNPYLLSCFRREAVLGRRVRHPNVCRIHHAPRRAAGLERPPVPYFTMEFIDGETLHERLRRAPLPLPDALAVARQLLLGLDAIHRAGVLHLDIKSSNVMLRPGRATCPLILDFGLARRVSGNRRERVRPLTGSFAYMPPEQILGRSPSVQNDIFAFGVVVFHMLTRELPFPSAQPSMASSIVQRLSAHAPRPSQVAPGVPGWLDAIVGSCLSEPEHRYPDVPALLDALDAGGREQWTRLG